MDVNTAIQQLQAARGEIAQAMAAIDGVIAGLTPVSPPPPPPPAPTDTLILDWTKDTAFVKALPDAPLNHMIASCAQQLADDWTFISEYMNANPFLLGVTWDVGDGAVAGSGGGTGLAIPLADRITHQYGWRDIGWPTGTCAFQCYQKAIGMFMNTSEFPLPALAFYQVNYMLAVSKRPSPWALGSALEFTFQAQVPWLYYKGQSDQIGVGCMLLDTKNNIILQVGMEVFDVPGVGAEGIGFDGWDYVSGRFAPGTTMTTNMGVGVSGSSPWTTGWKQFTGRVTGTNLLTIINRVNDARAARKVPLLSTTPADYQLTEFILSNEVAATPGGDHIVTGCSFRGMQVWARV